VPRLDHRAGTAARPSGPYCAQLGGTDTGRAADVEGVRETFARFRFEVVRTTHTNGAKGAPSDRAEVLIVNWPLPEVQ